MLPNIFILALASATVSVTVGASKLFKPFREWIVARNTFLGDLIGCPYCLGHWVSGILTLGYIEERGVAVWITLWLATTAISAVVAGTITRLFSSDE